MPKRRYLLLLAIVPATLLALTRVGQAEAQDCGFCQDWFDDDEEEWKHQFNFEGALFECGGGGSAGCHLFSWYYDLCSQYHESGASCVETVEAVAALRAAARSNDAAQLATAIGRYPSRVFLNDRASSLDVFSCQGAREGSLHLTEPLFRELTRLMNGSTQKPAKAGDLIGRPAGLANYIGSKWTEPQWKLAYALSIAGPSR